MGSSGLSPQLGLHLLHLLHGVVQVGHQPTDLVLRAHQSVDVGLVQRGKLLGEVLCEGSRVLDGFVAGEKVLQVLFLLLSQLLVLLYGWGGRGQEGSM